VGRVWDREAGLAATPASAACPPVRVCASGMIDEPVVQRVGKAPTKQNCGVTQARFLSEPRGCVAEDRR